MSKIGLKLYSTDYDKYFDEVISLYQQKVFDYIELYIIPNTTDSIENWKKLQTLDNTNSAIKIPFMLHAPDHKNKINLSNPENLDSNIEAYKQVDLFKQELSARCTIVSPGTRGSISETARQLKIINPKNILIKNNLYRIPSLSYAVGIGATVEEIEKFKKEYFCGFCLDIVNAICTANLTSDPPYELIREFNAFNPIMYRISGNNINSTEKQHLHLENANLDYSIITMVIRNNALITIDSDKSNGSDLNDFKEDVRFLRRFCK